MASFQPASMRRAKAAGARVAAFALVGLAVLPLDGCALAALPCRLASDTIGILPVVGHAASVPFDACAKIID
jgi:hypothetical protein